MTRASDDHSAIPLTARAIALLRAGQAEAAGRVLRDAREHGEAGFQPLHALGLEAARRGDNAAADLWLQAALEFAPDDHEALRTHGVVLRRLGRVQAALARVEASLRFDAGNAEVHITRANILNDLRRWPEALQASEQARALAPTNSRAALARGNALSGLGQAAAAMDAYRAAISLAPDRIEPWLNLGNALVTQPDAGPALAHFEDAVRRFPGDARVQAGRAEALGRLGRRGDAADALRAAVRQSSDEPFLLGRALHAQAQVCDWQAFGEQALALRRGFQAGKPASPPFVLLALPSSPAEQKACAELYCAHHFGRGATARPAPQPRAADAPIRIGYFSADFHNHATGVLMADLFERHDHAAVEPVAFAFGPGSTDAMRSRLRNAFHRFFEVSHLGDAAVADMARSLGVDIAVDLKGYTTDSRPGLFAHRAAPVQVSYLGYPGTMGAPFIDYIIADRTVIPPAARADYTERVAYLPASYQPNDRRRARPEPRSRRADHGLPETGVVLACFNNNYKILPDVFAIWMRLLSGAEGSVLWLFQDNPEAARNLRAEAARAGVDPARLVFAPRRPFEAHLERHHHIDLFLDTWPYNAHTTASDALWMGVPIVTRLGDTFAGRVAASLLRAVGLPELVGEDPEAYETLARELLSDHERLAGLHARLAEAGPGSQLFDTPRLAGDLEAVYRAMHARSLAGLPPQHLPAA